MMKMQTKQELGFQRVMLQGPLDIESVAEMKPEFEALTQEASNGVVLDMDAVTFLDSSGVGALVFMFKRLKAKQRSLHLVGLTGQPQKLINLLRINQTIPTHDQLESLSALVSENSVAGA